MSINATHGTNSKFDRFDPSYLGKHTDDNASDEYYALTAHIGFWFNRGGDLSIAYSSEMDCTLHIDNPYHVNHVSDLANYFALADATVEDLREMLENQGYDGIVVDCDEEFGGESYVVFDPDKITINN